MSTNPSSSASGRPAQPVTRPTGQGLQEDPKDLISGDLRFVLGRCRGMAEPATPDYCLPRAQDAWVTDTISWRPPSPGRSSEETASRRQSCRLSCWSHSPGLTGALPARGQHQTRPWGQQGQARETDLGGPRTTARAGEIRPPCGREIRGRSLEQHWGATPSPWG